MWLIAPLKRSENY